ARADGNKLITDENRLRMIDVHNSAVRRVKVQRRFGRSNNFANCLRVHRFKVTKHKCFPLLNIRPVSKRVTQENLAQKTDMKKSAISRLENHAQDVRLSTVSRVARALGKSLKIELVE